MPFANSTHAKHWIFTPQDLEAIRLKCDSATRSRLRGDVDYITLQEQRHYEYKIPDVCKRAGLPEKCSATAIMFFKRFYLSHTIVDYDPKIILLTCVYLASKTEESRVVIDDLCRRLGLPAPDKLLQNEMVLLQGIKFELLIYHPFRPLHGFLVSISETFGVDTTEIRNSAMVELNNAMKTDIPLLYPPSLIALASLSKISKDSASSPSPPPTFSSLPSFLATTLNSSPEAQKVVDEIVEIMEKMPRGPLGQEVVRNLDRKLKSCANATVERKEKENDEAEKEKAEKHQAKMARIKEQEKADMELLTGPMEINR